MDLKNFYPYEQILYNIVIIWFEKYRCDQKILMQMIRTANELKIE